MVVGGVVGFAQEFVDGMSDEVALHGVEDEMAVEVGRDGDGVSDAAESYVAHPYVIDGNLGVGQDLGREPLLVV